MFFIFVFIFVKIYSIQPTVAATHVDNPIGGAVLNSQDTRSPPRKARRQTTDTKAPAEEFEEELIRQLTDSTHISPVRKNNFLLIEDAEKESEGVGHIASTFPIAVIIPSALPSADQIYPYPSSQPKIVRKKEDIGTRGFALMPPKTMEDQDDDEDDLDEKVSPAAYRRERVPSRQSVTPRSTAAAKKSSPRFHHKESDKETKVTASLSQAAGTDGEGDSDEESDDDGIIQPYSPDSVKGQLTPRQRQLLHEEFKVSEHWINLMDACNQALHLKANDPAFAELVAAYSGPTEKEALMALKDQYPSPIRNPHLISKSLFYTPAARVGLGRSDLIEAKAIELATSLPADASLMPSTPPTPEEKAEIEKQQQELLKELERERGKSALDVAEEIKAEAKIWEKYFSYIQKRKAEIAKAKKCKTAKEGAKKIRKSEILDLFAAVILSPSDRDSSSDSKPPYQMVELGSYKLYFSMISLDLERRDAKGRTNRQRLTDLGLCPIGPDHFEMNYHHLTHHDALSHKCESVIVLITKTLHNYFSGSLHFREGSYQDLPRVDLDRAAFGHVRGTLFGPAIVEAIEKTS